MVKKLLFVLLVIIGVSTHIKAQSPVTQAIDLTVTTVAGEELNLFDILDGGQHVLIDFFFTTCGPCQQSAPHINAAYINFGCNSGDVFFVAMDYGNTNAATNFNKVALLESNVEGPQTGGANFNPDFMLPNGNYSHQHMLRHLITGQWGEEISTTSAGSFIDLNYTYIIPADYNGVIVNLANFSLVAFVTETTQEIESGTSAIPFITGLANENDASVSQVVVPEIVCGSEVEPKVIIENQIAKLFLS
jgi:thiol-disulfide isomerase/thioredoxin